MANCDTCDNKPNLPLVVWADVFRCINCANVPTEFDGPEPWDMTPEEAHPYNAPSPYSRNIVL